MIALLIALTLSQPRLALAVGSNVGGEGRDPLWFAETDAQRFAEVLIELGQFRKEDVTVLKGPSSAELTRALLQLAERARTAHGQALIMFYYSGHADPSGLELGPERFLYGDLSNALATMGEGARIAVLDACHSGALTQVKGARPAPLDFEVVREPRAEGLAFITSSSASEKAQESAQLGGSFFTHHLVAALRGAADADRDGRVTLTESYRYAYHRTLTATSESGATPQHPTWAMRMSGKGEVVLVDLRQAHAVLRFEGGAGKSYLISNERSGEVVAEVATGGEPRKVALPQGRYRIERLLPSPRLSGFVELPATGGATVDDAQLTEVPVLTARAKGDLEVKRTTFIGAELWLQSPVLTNFGAGYGVGLGFRQDLPWLSLMLGLSYSQKLVDDVGFLYRYHAGTLTAALALRLEVRAAVSVLLGLKGGGAYALQVLPDGRSTNDLIWLGGPIVGAAVRVAERFSARALLGGTVQTFRLNGAQVARFAVDLALALELAP